MFFQALPVIPPPSETTNQSPKFYLDKQAFKRLKEK
jgi:hypothetical protein